MKLIFLAVFVSIGFLVPMKGMTQNERKENVLLGMFDGRTPCQELASQIHEKTTIDCIKIKWRLNLYKDSVTGAPSSYSMLGFVYKKENPRTGEWHIIKGTKTNPEAIVYQLDQPGMEPLFLQKLNDDVLFFLDREKNLMVGNRDFSYTLNRVVKQF